MFSHQNVTHRMLLNVKSVSPNANNIEISTTYYKCREKNAFKVLITLASGEK